MKIILLTIDKNVLDQLNSNLSEIQTNFLFKNFFPQVEVILKNQYKALIPRLKMNSIIFLGFGSNNGH